MTPVQHLTQKLDALRDELKHQRGQGARYAAAAAALPAIIADLETQEAELVAAIALLSPVEA